MARKKDTQPADRLRRQFLQGAGCDLIQGYLAGEPIDADSAASEYV